MGRKPNQVILQYFSRGSKLDDASNRYQHTCKGCGEHFPKGRIEGLINHLTKKCPSLSYPQKQEIVIQFYDLSETALPPIKSGTNVDTSKPISLPFSPAKQNFNSLNILAEASRRVGRDDGAALPLDPSLDLDSFTQTYLNDEDTLTDNVNDFSYGPSDSVLDHDDHTQDLSQPAAEGIPSQGPELRSIAASANNMLPGDSDLGDPTMGDGLLENALPGGLQSEHGGPQAISHTEAVAAQENHQTPFPTLLGSPLKPLAMAKEAHFVSESGRSLKSPKPKVRGKFTPMRRQEVREMRQRGACLRCRMLKKTCSNGNPCQACAAIESPRIWKNPCVRTKLVNEFDLYFVGLHTTMTYHEITRLKDNSRAQEDAGSLDIYHLDESPTGLSLKATRIVSTVPTNTTNLDESTPAGGAASMDCLIISSDNDEVSKKIGMYIRTTQDELVSQDENPFLKTTIKTAQALAIEKSDHLLTNILWLWTCTLLLVEGPSRWQGITSSERAVTDGEYGQPPLKPLPSNTSPESNLMINAQLRVGVELCGKALNKSILGDLERRLLQRRQDRKFDTYLAVIVLLNCFERMCWLFKAQQTKQPDKWPFPSSSEEFVRQGERFADIIDLLVDMRSLPPRAFFDPVKNTLLPLGDPDESVRQWFDEISITKEYLQFNNDRPFDETDFRSMDGRFFARLLQPESERQPKNDMGKLT